MSLTRNRQHSIKRSPQPYSSRAINENTPSAPSTSASTCATSSGGSTVGKRFGRRDRTASKLPNSISNTSRYKNTIAFSA